MRRCLPVPGSGRMLSRTRPAHPPTPPRGAPERAASNDAPTQKIRSPKKTNGPGRGIEEAMRTRVGEDWSSPFPGRMTVTTAILTSMVKVGYVEPDRGFAAHGLHTENGVAMGNARPGPDPGRDADVGPQRRASDPAHPGRAATTKSNIFPKDAFLLSHLTRDDRDEVRRPDPGDRPQ